MFIVVNFNIVISGFIDLSRVYFKVEKKGWKNLDLLNDKFCFLVVIFFIVWMLYFNYSYNII